MRSIILVAVSLLLAGCSGTADEPQDTESTDAAPDAPAAEATMAPAPKRYSTSDGAPFIVMSPAQSVSVRETLIDSVPQEGERLQVNVTWTATTEDALDMAGAVEACGEEVAQLSGSGEMSTEVTELCDGEVVIVLWPAGPVGVHTEVEFTIDGVLHFTP